MGACFEKIVVSPDKPEKCADNFYQLLEIRNSRGKKWQSSKRSPNANVPVAPASNEPKLWFVEELSNSALLSFFVFTENQEKLHLSYEDDVDDVTLKYEQDAGNKRWFVALLQPDIGVFLRAAGTKNRFVYKHETNLRMKTTDNPTQDMEWFIEKFCQETATGRASIPVEIFHASSNLQWISSDSLNGSIPVSKTATLQNWFTTLSTTCEITTADNLFVTVDNGLVLLANSDSTGKRKFTASRTTNGAKHIKIADAEVYLSQGTDGVLCVTDDVRIATPWEFHLKISL